MESQQSPVAPTKICPHCGTQAQTADKKCPNCGKKYKKHTGLKIFAAICLAGLVLTVGCALLIGGAVNSVNKEANKHAITKAQFDSIAQGTSEAEVKKTLGDPADRQQFEQQDAFNNQPQGSSCIYYAKKGEDLLGFPSFQFCFTEGNLDSKNAY